MSDLNTTTADLSSASRRKQFSWPTLVILIALCLASALAYVLIDASVSTWVSQNDSTLRVQIRTPWVKAIQQVGKVWGLIWLLLFWAWLARRPRELLVASVALLLTLSVLPIKEITRRPRPGREADGFPADVVGKRHRSLPSWSFPSGDTAVVFAVATALVSCTPVAGRVAFFLLAAAVAALRVLTHDHYPSDVLAGAALGVACGWGAMVLVERLAARPPPAWLTRARESGRFRFLQHPAFLPTLLVLMMILDNWIGSHNVLVLLFGAWPISKRPPGTWPIGAWPVLLGLLVLVKVWGSRSRRV